MNRSSSVRLSYPWEAARSKALRTPSKGLPYRCLTSSALFSMAEGRLRGNAPVPVVELGGEVFDAGLLVFFGTEEVFVRERPRFRLDAVDHLHARREIGGVNHGKEIGRASCRERV